jgi:hypothetical protein
MAVKRGEDWRQAIPVSGRRMLGKDRKRGVEYDILGKLALHRLRKMKTEKKRVSAKRRMMHVALDSDFMYEAVFSK